MRYERNTKKRFAGKLPQTRLRTVNFEKAQTKGEWSGQAGGLEGTGDGGRMDETLWNVDGQWKTIFDLMPGLVMLLDRDHRIIRVNETMARALGVSPDQVLEKQCFRCICSTGEPHDSCVHKKAMADGEEHTQEIHELRLGGYFLVSATPVLDEAGTPIGSVHMMRDITESKRVEKEKIRLVSAIKQTEKTVLETDTEISSPRTISPVVHDVTREVELQRQLRQAEKLVDAGKVAATIAHEIKNPIFAISSGIQILQQNFNLNDDEHQETLDIIFRQTMRVDRLIKQLQTFSAPQELNLIPNQINWIISEVILLNRDLLRSRKIVIREKIPENMPSVHVDKDRIMQVLINLLQNAIDVSKQNDCIEIACSIDKKKERVVIEVKDEGPGIPEDQRDKVFDLFFTTKKSSGMGLAISKRIVLDHGGDIRVEPRKNRGTKMVVDLPFGGDSG